MRNTEGKAREEYNISATQIANGSQRDAFIAPWTFPVIMLGTAAFAAENLWSIA